MTTSSRTESDCVEALRRDLGVLKLTFIAENYVEFAKQATERHWDPIAFLARRTPRLRAMDHG
jgi:hypothetical protein